MLGVVGVGSGRGASVTEKNISTTGSWKMGIRAWAWEGLGRVWGWGWGWGWEGFGVGVGKVFAFWASKLCLKNQCALDM